VRSDQPVLVTGGCGFIGSHLVDALVHDGYSVRVVDDLSTGSRAQLNAAAELRVGDVVNEEFVREALRDVSVVFHLAARGSVLRSVEDPLGGDAANIHGTLAMLIAARAAGVSRVVFASSSSVYGDATIFPTPESARLAPMSPYGVSKLAGEHYCRVWASLHGVETVALRYFNVFGPRQSREARYARVVPSFIGALTEHQAPLVDGDGKQSRDFTYVDDAVRATLSAGRRPIPSAGWAAYNVAGGAEHSVVDVFEALAKLLDFIGDPIHGPVRPGDVRRTYADLGAAFEDLGYRPEVTLEEGLHRTVAAMRLDPQ
jgi:UDP-glucose 4-epimerase